ncbi:hypothetical protein [Microbispora sp. ATCC PTA-5024]|uniref:hypothetical protein n=1 Tax=Microbispora sp. ATCC PTA-5024 TaxID=316330 RepID=UPI0003DBB406|nr:hypothetical protein [Microbispora sp. ATCC PTA-5024]ETK36095.1 hypothetical protein MPTA5024_10750 [Microbispora sp. ATCC PTA-5024]
MTKTINTTAWPEGVIARYLTVGGATVDIRVEKDDCGEGDDHVAACTGCTSTFGSSKSDWNLQFMVRPWAQSHAEKCRAMPKP